MRNYLRETMNSIASYIELFLSFFLCIVILFITLRLILDSVGNIATGDYGLEYYLQNAMTLAIGVEFVKMLCSHSPGTVIEVLLFAIARQMVVEHLGIKETLIGIIAIAGLFAIRKYLFSSMDEVDHIILRGSLSVGHANFLAKTKIPEGKDLLLRDVITEKLTADNKSVAEGAIVYYSDCALRIDQIQNDVIKRVEVIRTL